MRTAQRRKIPLRRWQKTTRKIHLKERIYDKVYYFEQEQTLMKARLPEEYRGGGQAAMMKQIQKMQEDMARVQEEVENTTFSASVGGGTVTAECNGKQEMLNIKIAPEVIDPEDAEMLEDLVLAAVNEALSKASEAMQQGIAQTQSGMNLPGMM
jgi:DNA-binding YbaB/EbfC family protein